MQLINVKSETHTIHCINIAQTGYLFNIKTTHLDSEQFNNQRFSVHTTH